MGRKQTITSFFQAVPLSYFGFAFLHTWEIMESNVSVPLEQDYGSLGTSELSTAIMLLIGFVALKTSPSAFRKIAPVASCGFLILATATLYISWQLQMAPQVIHTASTLFSIFGTKIGMVLWIDLYAGLNPVRVAFVYAAAVLGAQGMSFLLETAAPIRLVIALTTLAALSLITYRKALRHAQQEKIVVGQQRRAMFPGKLIAVVAAFSFAYGFISLQRTGGMGYASAIPAALVVTLVLLHAESFSISSLIKLSIPFMVIAFLLVAFTSGNAKPEAVFLFRMGFAAFEMMIVMATCITSFATGVSAMWLFCLVRATQSFMRRLGADLTAAMPQSPEAHLTIGLAVIAIAVAVSLLLLTEKNLLSSWGASLHLEEDDGEKLREEQVKASIASLANRCGLTERETEVVYLAVSGLTNIQIANRICVAEGTVKAHLYHVYQKANVKSRKELMRGVGVDPQEVRRETTVAPGNSAKR